MNLIMPQSLADLYRSPAQKARVVTEAWATRELYCPICLAPALTQTAVNCQATDFVCPSCDSPFQLKSSKSGIGAKVPDGAYQAMLSAIREDRTPNLLLLSYRQTTWQVLDLMIIPRFAFSEHAIIPRKPLADSARRAGWIGCNINLDQIPPEARIPMVVNGLPVASDVVFKRYSKLKALGQMKTSERGWTLAILTAIQCSGWTEFTTRDAYGFEGSVSAIFPGNRHVRQKIRQRLQVLRDLGFLIHVERGVWRTVSLNIN